MYVEKCSNLKVQADLNLICVNGEVIVYLFVENRSAKTACQLHVFQTLNAYCRFAVPFIRDRDVTLYLFCNT